MINTAENIKPKATPKIYVACLASYNQGMLHGDWIDLTDCKEFNDLQQKVDQIIKSSKAFGAEEVAIHDYDNFLDLGEYPDFQKLFEVYQAINNSEIDNAILYAHIERNFGVDYFLENPDQILQIEDSYVGDWQDFKEYAEHYAYEVDEFQSIPEHMQHWFDWESYSQDLSYNHDCVDILDDNGYVEGVAIFYHY